jgi:predicted nucleotidyltransferase component of viral defense system
MDASSFHRKYAKVLDILPDVADCAQGKLILVGGTALALFYLKHRVSVDLDFVPVSGDDKKLKEELKGCLSKKGYRTVAGAFQNQFVVQFEDTSIKIEVFEPEPEIKPKRFEERVFGGTKVKIALLDDLLRMKQSAYVGRRESRDLFDIFCILRRGGPDPSIIKNLIAKFGVPKNLEDIENMALDPQDAVLFKKVVSDAS